MFLEEDSMKGYNGWKVSNLWGEKKQRNKSRP
jgi:hypothetical protein